MSYLTGGTSPIIDGGESAFFFITHVLSIPELL